ncbi:MAG TPA: T9SS type A sorting domain-containing protein [Bacteroidia bacterium]|jgi:OOP family OmpA-OmpF porin|nr:T9SS type A sorting domain-containing protein [Bacteroidia bacterium]
MKRKALLSLLFLIALCFAKGQNLVPNYSFENIIQCPQNCNQFINYVSDWTGQGENYGLFYFTAQCPGDTGTGSGATSSSGSVPYNADYGFQYAHTGVSYAGISPFVTGFPADSIYPYGNTNYKNSREYLETVLADSLIAGVKYYVTFFTNLHNSSEFACSDVGAYFSNSYVTLDNSSLPELLPYTPQVANNPKKQELIDTLNWMKVSGSFMAKGGEKYIVIGNFKNDSLSSIRYVGYSGTGSAYYYIDDVIVSTDSNYADSLESVNQLTSNKGQLKVFPNPSKGVFTLTLPSPSGEGASVVDVYNMMGERIYEALLPQTPKGALSTIDISKQPAGIYLYRITTRNGDVIGSEKLIIQ